MTAINRGVLFEVCYAQAVMGDAEKRKNVIANVMAIVRGTKGRGIVLSSGAEGVLGVRPPADVVNLLSVWGLARERGTEGLVVNPRAVVANEALKRRSFRGVVEVIDGGEVPVRPKDGSAAVIKEGKNEKGRSKPKSGDVTTSREDTPQTIGKRKAEESSNGEGTPTMSKRQAKKMRIAALKADKESGGSSSNTTPPPHETSSTIKNKANG